MRNSDVNSSDRLCGAASTVHVTMRLRPGVVLQHRFRRKARFKELLKTFKYF